jgi:hypothetical protein
VTRIGQLIDEGEKAAAGSDESDLAKEQRLQELHQLLQSLVPPPPDDDDVEDSGETALLLTDDPKTAYQAAEAFGSAPAGSSTQGIGDWCANAINGAKEAARVLSYNVTKTRAGDIGRSGLGTLLAELHRRSPGLRVHLIGHSFGARLVSALSGVGAPVDSPIASLLLLQGAFSHWSFAHPQDNPFGKPGPLNICADRVHGPLVATFSVYDWAVGRWYPKASFLAQDDVQAEVASRWGGMGSDGFQAVAPAADRQMPATGDTDYSFSANSFFPGRRRRRHQQRGKQSLLRRTLRHPQTRNRATGHFRRGRAHLTLSTTTHQMASGHVPSSAQYPRRGDGRKAPTGVAMRWRQRHPCPRQHDEHSGQDQGTGQEQGRIRQMNGQAVRALHVPYRKDSHGLTRRAPAERWGHQS